MSDSEQWQVQIEGRNSAWKALPIVATDVGSARLLRWLPDPGIGLPVLQALSLSPFLLQKRPRAVMERLLQVVGALECRAVEELAKEIGPERRHRRSIGRNRTCRSRDLTAQVSLVFQ